MGSIFLSVGVPGFDSPFHDTCDRMLIQAALRTFLYTVLGRKHLVFGGHPSISPLILAVCEDLKVENKCAVTVYQSEFLDDGAPKVNSRFDRLVKVAAASTLESSLANMSEIMFRSHQFETAIFIGGDQATLEEHAKFKYLHPTAKVIALRSAGGTSAAIASMEAASHAPSSKSPREKDYDELLDYVGLFTKGLEIGLNSERNLKSEFCV